jgi:CBS domain-containing protein
MLLKDICVLDVACCTRDLSVLGAARMMRQQHTGDLVVVDDVDEQRVPVGIITDRDIVVDVLAQGHDPAKTSVGEVMTTQLAIAAGSEDVSQALARMRSHGVRRIPVVNDSGGILGIVTLDDLLKLHVEQGSDLLEVIAEEQTRESRAKR